MAEKSVEDIKTKLIHKIFKIRRERTSYKTFKKFQKATKRINNLEREYSGLIKRSKNDIMIGRINCPKDNDIVKLRKLSLEDLKNF